MKMIQKYYPTYMDRTEYMYDGQLRVVDNIIEIPKEKEYWEDELYNRGYRKYDETPLVAAEEPSTDNTEKESFNILEGVEGFAPPPSLDTTTKGRGRPRKQTIE